MAIKSLSIRIDTEMLDKLHVVADYEGRSANSQINILIRDCIADYEKEHGPIPAGKRERIKRRGEVTTPYKKVWDAAFGIKRKR